MNILYSEKGRKQENGSQADNLSYELPESQKPSNFTAYPLTAYLSKIGFQRSILYDYSQKVL